MKRLIILIAALMLITTGCHKDKVEPRHSIVTYYGNGGLTENGESSVKDVQLGSDRLTIKDNMFTNEDKEFKCWNTKSDGNGNNLHPTDDTFLEELNLYAIWLNKYTITFNPNGGTGTMSPQTVVDGVPVNLHANAFTRNDYSFKCWNTKANGSGTSYSNGSSVTLHNNLTLYAQWTPKNGFINGHEYVNLGLPSGLLWATCNVGASSPQDYGNYYAWGETTTKSYYDWSTYKWCNGEWNSLTKYCTSSNYGIVDNKTVLEMSDDAARVNWGGNWRTPTRDELQELDDKCTWTWTTQGGKNGYRVTGPNGNNIFLPAAGYREFTSLYSVGSYGVYQSSLIRDDLPFDMYYLSFIHGGVGVGDDIRYIGRSVRPVCQPQN